MTRAAPNQARPATPVAPSSPSPGRAWTGLRIGLPKGSLQDSTVDLFHRAGYKVVIPDRSYFPTIDDPEMQAIMFRSQEMSRYVEDGVIDVGITGRDWIVETGSDVHEVCELVYSKATSSPVRW